MSNGAGRESDRTGRFPGGSPGPEGECGGAQFSDAERRARDVIYRLLAARARSQQELRQALQRKGIDEETAERVLQKFVDAGLVDDAAFARDWVRSRSRSRGLGRKALGFELRRKGVDESLIEIALSEVDSDDEEERARELVQRKLRTMTIGDPVVVTRRLIGMLARKGYSEGLAFRIVREELERSGAGTEFDSEVP